MPAFVPERPIKRHVGWGVSFKYVGRDGKSHVTQSNVFDAKTLLLFSTMAGLGAAAAALAAVSLSAGG